MNWLDFFKNFAIDFPPTIFPIKPIANTSNIAIPITKKGLILFLPFLEEAEGLYEFVEKLLASDVFAKQISFLSR